MTERNCDECGKISETKNLKKIRGRYMCRSCNNKNLKNRIKETIEKSGIKKEIEKLDKKIKKEYRDRHKRKKIEEAPKIKGSTFGKPKNKSECYITFQEKQALLRVLMKRGLDFNEAKERVKELVESQKILRKELKKQSKSEEEIKIKQQELLEELWQS